MGDPTCPPRRGAAGALVALALPALLACGGPEALTACEPAGELHPVCAFHNPEDLASAGAGWVVVSQMPSAVDASAGSGGLVAWRPPEGEPVALFPGDPSGSESLPVASGAHADGSACPGPPDPALFAPHGIDVAPGAGARVLWVVNHGGREAVERFRLETRGEGPPQLTWEDCVPLPEEAQGNDVVALPDGGFAVTWFMPRSSGAGLALVFARLALGLDTGRVLRWSPEEGLREVEGSEASAPNGIEASPDGRALFVAAWGERALLRLDLEEGTRQSLSLPHRPDNLTWAPDGSLLVAGQEGRLTDVMACFEGEGGTCGMPWSVLAVDPEALTSEVLLHEAPARTTGAASVALATEAHLLVGTFAGDRIVWSAR